MTENNLPCPYCQGTGFYQGEICRCITGVPEPEMPDFLRDLFKGFKDEDSKKP